MNPSNRSRVRPGMRVRWLDGEGPRVGTVLELILDPSSDRFPGVATPPTVPGQGPVARIDVVGEAETVWIPVSMLQRAHD